MKCFIKKILDWFSRNNKENLTAEPMEKMAKGASPTSFRILGVEVFGKCDTKIRKCLKEDVLYLLCGDYEKFPCDVHRLRYVGDDTGCCNRHVYDVEGWNGKVRVNVSAIVGKNGDGKSSLLELIIRLLNNFAYVQGYLCDQDLEWVEGLRAALYYEVDGCCYAIVAEGEDGAIGWYKDGKAIPPCGVSATDNEKKKHLREHHAQELFYTLVVNFSLFAYNPEMLAGENAGEDCWIDKLFHKNDSYQTPIVLNPMREEDGTIDVINEMDLSRQRLLSIYSMGSSDMHHELYRVNKDKYAVGYAFKLVQKDTKFEVKSLRNYCVYHVKDYYNWTTIDALESGSIAEAGLAKKASVLNFMNYWNRCEEIIDNHPGILRYMELSTKKARESRGYSQTDFSHYLGIIHEWMKSPDIEIEGKELVRAAIEHVRLNQGTWLNYAMFYRLALLVETWDILQNIYPKVFTGSLDEAFKAKTNTKKAACLYVVYKLTSITENYNPYRGQSYHRDVNYQLLINRPDNQLQFNRLRDDIKELLKKYDYRTMKMHQALNYLLHQHDDYYNACNLHNDKDGYTHLLTFQKLREQIKGMQGYRSVRDASYFLPPAIFEGDIIIENKDPKQFRLATLSSGELQLLNSVGSVVYHLRNLDDHTYKENIQYRNVNIILEEVELYFHPEFQKQYIDYLLKQIEYLKLKNIKCINIIVVTHSPFVLSDVFQSDTLYLTEGEVARSIDYQTFGANLYDLMADSFFLEDNTIGDVANRYVSTLVDRIKAGETVEDCELDMVGDSILRGYLYELRSNPNAEEEE